MRRYLTVFSLAFIWSVFYVSVSQINHDYAMNPFTTGVLVRSITFVLLTIVMVARKEMKSLFRVQGALPLLLLIGIFGFSLDITSFLGFQMGSASVGTILLKTDILMVNLMSIFILKERFGWFDWLLTGLLLVGVAMVLGINPFDLDFKVTDLFFVLSAFFVSCNAFVIKRVQANKAPKISNLVIAYYNNFVTMIVFFLISLLGSTLNGALRLSSDPGLLTWVLLAGMGQFFIYIFYYKSLSELPVWLVKAILLLIPVFTLLFDLFFKDKIPGISQLLGTVLVILAAAAMIVSHEKKRGDEVLLSRAKEQGERA